MSLYKKLLLGVKNGDSFSIDFNKRTLKINRKKIELDSIVNLISNEDLVDENITNIVNGDFYDTVEILYSKYRKSIPNSRNKKSYFKALDIDDLTDEELIYGLNRNYAQFILEAYILFYSIKYQDKINWNENNWFYQGKNKDLILLKKWVKPF